MMGIGLAVAAAAVGAGLFVYGMARTTLINQGIREASVTVSMSAERLGQEAVRHPGHSPVEDVADLAAGRGYMLLLYPDGTPIAASGTLPPRTPRTGWLLTPAPGWFAVRGLPYVYARASVRLAHQAAVLVAVEPLNRTAALLRVLVKTLILGGLLLLLTSLAGVLWVVRQLTDPLRALQKAAEGMSPERLDQSPITASSDLAEVVSLTASFNRMLQRLAAAHEREREFLSNASHSLRTPVQVIRGYARSLSQWGHQDPVSRQQAVKALVRESNAMETLIQRLLQLSRMASDQALDLQATELNAWMDAAEPDLQDACMHHPFAVKLDERPLWVDTEPELLKTVIGILVENADAYADPESEVRVVVERTPRGGRVEVVNSGPAIPDAMMGTLFQRFERGERRIGSNQHFGLGLAIADTIVRRVEGVWDVGSREGLTWFAVELPFAAKLDVTTPPRHPPGVDRPPGTLESG